MPSAPGARSATASIRPPEAPPPLLALDLGWIVRPARHSDFSPRSPMTSSMRPVPDRDAQGVADRGYPDDIPDRDGPRDECGVFGVYAPGHAVARLAYLARYALQHRGQESAGIATCEGGHITTLRESGLVSQVFDEQKLRALDGDMAIAHVRYSTTGGGSWENSQPVWRDDGREVALAHNGNLTNAVELHNELTERGVKFRGTSDSEIMAA